LRYDPEIYDITRNTWVREARELRSAEPANNEIYDEFMKRLVIFQEKQTGVITVSLEFLSPDLAQKWLQLFVTEVNEAMRRNDVKEATTTIEYLDKKLQETQVTEVRELLFSLLEENTKTLTMATVRPDYVFKLIDPPYKPDMKSGPVRSLIVLGALFGCFMLFCIVVLSAMVLRRAQQSTSK
jgi:capsule polysaccharide export protein KpsE/RkpR